MLTGSPTPPPRPRAPRPAPPPPPCARLYTTGRGRRRPLGQVGHGVGLAPPLPVRRADVELVPGALTGPGHVDLPDPGPAERAHRVPAAVPVVEIPDQPHPAGVGRPDREGRADQWLETCRGRLAGLARPVHMRPEDLPELLVPALADQVQIHLAKRGKVPVGVIDECLRQRRPAARAGIADGA